MNRRRVAPRPHDEIIGVAGLPGSYRKMTVHSALAVTCREMLPFVVGNIGDRERNESVPNSAVRGVLDLDPMFL
jgi:hypothetical protein